MDGKTWIDTEYGKIHISDIPLVETESDTDKLIKCIAFFVFIIVVIIIVLYLMGNGNDTQYEKFSNIENEPLMLDVTGSIKATSIKLFDMHKELPLSKVIIITTDGTVINYNIEYKNTDTKSKYSIKNYMYGDTQVFAIRFRTEFDIDKIYVVSNTDKFIEHINVDLLYNEVPVWHYSGKLNPEQYNKIEVTNKQINPDIRHSIPMPPLTEVTDLPPKKLIINESSLAIEITENDERYVR